MTDIEAILSSGDSDRSGAEPIPTDEEFRIVEAQLAFRFPESYREFVLLGGLSELCINHRVLPPAEIVDSLKYLPDLEHVPFADNGCGDLYCWPRTETAEPVVLLADHEAGYTYTEVAESFTRWLEEHKF